MNHELAWKVDAYFRDHKLRRGEWLRADMVLALLRINTEDSLAEAEKLMGKKITVCPPAVPPWPPKPVQTKKMPTVAKLKDGVTHVSEEFSYVRVGRTREQILARGVTARNLDYWTQRGDIEWSTR
jgi:hypothetical protein